MAYKTADPKSRYNNTALQPRTKSSTSTPTGNYFARKPIDFNRSIHTPRGRLFRPSCWSVRLDNRSRWDRVVGGQATEGPSDHERPLIVPRRHSALSSLVAVRCRSGVGPVAARCWSGVGPVSVRCRSGVGPVSVPITAAQRVGTSNPFSMRQHAARPTRNMSGRPGERRRRRRPTE